MSDDDKCFDKWYEENELRFHQAMFSERQVALSAWYEGYRRGFDDALKQKKQVEWTEERPMKPGRYWCSQWGRLRLVKVWHYKGESKILFTNEDGGAIISDDMYNDAYWYGPIEIEEPEPHRM